MSTLSPELNRSILLLSLATFTSMCAQRICDAMLPELSREFGVGLAQAAQVVSAFALVYGAAQLVYGPLGDRLGKFRVVAWAALCCAGGSLAAFFATSLDWLVATRVLVAAFAAAVIPLSMAWVGDAVDYAQRQETMARVALGTTLGVAAGQMAGGLATDWLGWRWAFVLMALLFATVGVLLLRDWQRQQRVAQASGTPEGGRAAAAQGHFLVQMQLIARTPWSRMVLLVAFSEGALGFGVQAIWASHLHHLLGISLSGAGAIAALYGLGGMAYMAVARQLIPRLGEHGLALVGTSLLALCACAIALSPWVWLAVLGSLVGGFGFFMFHNTMQVNATQMAPAARGTAMSLFALCLFMGQACGVLLGATLAAGIGSAATIMLAAGLLFALGTWFARGLRRRVHAAAAA